MSRFALRIFLSTWLIVATTVALTVFATRWLPTSDDSLPGRRYDGKMLELVVRQLQPHLSENSAEMEAAVRALPIFELDHVVQLYVIDANGKDVLDRELPSPVARLVREFAPQGDYLPLITDPRLEFVRGELGPYTVVSFYGRFPLGRVFAQPGARTLLGLFAVLVSAAVSIVLARFVVLPVRRLRVAGQQVAEGDLSVRVAPTVGSRKDDIAELARDFDVMTERVHALIESQQRLMRDVSHELRSPLARLQALLSIARQHLESSERVPLDRMERELERLDELIGEILSYARLETMNRVERRPTDLVDLIENIVDDADVEGQEEGKQIRLRAPTSCVMELDAGLIQSAIENVVRNALKHTAPQTTVDVTITESPSSVNISVHDQGPGVPPEALDKLFDPFFRVEDSRGTHSGSGGIGLAIASRSVRLHGGTISATNRPEGGLTVLITLHR